jgi:predicted TIM-barrel fold metal-dependent hydrolase
MTITDAQVHLFPPNTPEHPWPPAEGRSQPIRPSYSAEEMLGAMGAIGVHRAVIVPPAWAGEDNRYALAACEKYPGRFAVMGRIDPYAPDTPARLEGWRTQPHMIGIRMSGRWGTTPNTIVEALQDDSLAWYWAACERLRIPIMVLTRHLAAKLGPIAERHPALTLVVDHMSTQEGDSVAKRFAAFDDMLRLARYPRVHIKVSGGPNRSDQPFPFADVQPYFRKVYDTFGPRRMLWAADITQLTRNTYAECLRFFQEGLPFLSAEDKEWILHRTAAEALGWP